MGNLQPVDVKRNRLVDARIERVRADPAQRHLLADRQRSHAAEQSGNLRDDILDIVDRIAFDCFGGQDVFDHRHIQDRFRLLARGDDDIGVALVRFLALGLSEGRLGDARGAGRRQRQ